MNREYYDLLGLNEDATDEEIKERYGELKKKYNEDRWLDGEAGNEAARMLNKLDTAYTEIMSARREQSKNTEGRRSPVSTSLTSAAPSGTIFRRWCSIRKIGRTRAKSSWKSPCRWIRTIGNIRRLTAS